MLKLIVRGVFKDRQMFKFVRRILKENQMRKFYQKSFKGETNAHKDERNQNNWNCARSQKGKVKLDRNQTGALVTTHTIFDKVPAVSLAGDLSFLADELNQILCSAL